MSDLMKPDTYKLGIDEEGEEVVELTLHAHRLADVYYAVRDFRRQALWNKADDLAFSLLCTMITIEKSGILDKRYEA